jgi:muramoyltetrapeptide carboxypeptidase
MTDAGRWRVPPPLAPGSTIAVVASSSPFDRALGLRGLGVLSRRYRVRFTRRIFERTGYLAGDAEARLAELERALYDDDVAALVAARGGYGASQLVHHVDWSVLRARPKWIVGFSDVTALHLEATHVRVASLHAPHLTAFGQGWSATHEAVFAALERPFHRAFDGLDVLCAGAAAGPLVGGNLTLVHAQAAAGRLALPRGAVVLLEDVTERPYRIDRMLTTLLAGGHLAGAAAFVLGEFTDCGPGPDGVTLERVLRATLGQLGVPVLSGAPVGHGRRNEPVVLGAHAEVEAPRRGQGALRLSPPRAPA